MQNGNKTPDKEGLKRNSRQILLMSDIKKLW